MNAVNGVNTVKTNFLFSKIITIAERIAEMLDLTKQLKMPLGRRLCLYANTEIMIESAYDSAVPSGAPHNPRSALPTKRYDAANFTVLPANIENKTIL